MNTTLTKREKDELERIKQTLIIAWSGSKPPKVYDFFYSWCGRTNNPCVRIWKGRKYANISMELPGSLLDAEGRNQLRSICIDYGFPDAGNFRNPSVEDFPLKDAADFARKLVAIGLDFCRRNPPKL